MSSATEWTFAQTLDPLSAYSAQSSLLEGFYNPHGVGLHGNYGATLCVQPAPERTANEGIGGITIDRAIALGLGADVPFKSINFGHSYGGRHVPAVSNVSADGANQPYPAMSDPAAIIDQLFALTGPTAGPNAAQRLAKKRRLLDVMTDDISRMQGRLAGEERAIMDQYLNSVVELEQQLDRLRQVQCAALEYTGPTPGYSDEINPHQSKFYYDAAQAALACGLTRVVTIAHEGVGDEPLQPRYPFEPVSVPESLHDGVQHEMNGLKNDSDEGWADAASFASKVSSVYRWRSQQVAEFLDGLQTLDMGGVTVGARTLMMWLNTGGGRHHQGHEEIPLMFIGNPDGRLNTGRYEKLETNTVCVSDAFLTLAHAMQVPLETFGDPAHSVGPLAGALA
jgi:hypothetical protein